MIILFFLLAVIAIVYLGMKTKTLDPYGTFHLALNVLPEEKLKGQRPSTEWLNMGYWKDTKSFPEACEALALKIIYEGQPIPNGRVLDVGHGCGDSLLLYLSNSSIPIPETLSGITSLKTHFAIAQSRISIAQSSSERVSKCRIKLWCDNAVYSSAKSAPDHPLNPLLSEPLYTTITAIDCAYHFETRELFLQQCFTRLAPGGRLALGDLVISKSLPFSLHLLVSTFLSVRKENLVTIDEYKACMVRSGYVDIQIEDISNDVFPPFSNFLSSRGGLWYILAMIFKWWYVAGGRFVIVGGSKPK